MDDNTRKIRNNGINVPEIMATIRENIRCGKPAGELLPYPDSPISRSSNVQTGSENNEASQRDLGYINSNWDIHNTRYSIRSHRPFIGKILVKGRQLVHGEVRRYVDPTISWQTEFNASTVRIINQISQRCAALDQRQQELEAWVAARVVEDQIQKELTQKSALLASTAKDTLNYFLFEEQFRGSREDITQRQLAFLPYFEKCSRVLDIGCGRGEFLEILKDHAIGGIGVDNDPDMVAFCHSRQLEVEHSDAIVYLEKLEDQSLDGIFIDQVVEHLEFDYLIRLLVLCHQKMKSGYYIVIETVNPLSFISFVNFYIDMTHKRPVHPETLQYLLSSVGFRFCEKKFFSPVSDEDRLKTIGGAADMNENERKNVDLYNHNVEMLNTVLFGAQDYAVIGKK